MLRADAKSVTVLAGAPLALMLKEPAIEKPQPPSSATEIQLEA
jgi:hypothetical protein